MSDNREYLSGRDESFVSPHSPGTSNGYTDEIVFGGLSPVSYERYAERFAGKYNEIMSKMMNVEAEVGSSGMTSVWRVPSFGMHRGVLQIHRQVIIDQLSTLRGDRKGKNIALIQSLSREK